MASYSEIFTDGAVSLSGGATWAADANVLIADQTQTISTSLDVSTNAIDLLHILGGSPRIVGSGGTTATIKIDNTYTTDPNFVWKAGGYSNITFDTNACPLAIYAGGDHVIAGGTVTVLVVAAGTVTIPSGTTVGTLVLTGGRVVAEAAVATVHQSGGRLDATARVGATSFTLSGGSAYVENTSGSACTILNLEAAGSFYPLAGDVATLNRRGGRIGYDAAVRSLTLGSTAFTNYAGSTPASTGIITVSNLVDYAAYVTGTGGGVVIP